MSDPERYSSAASDSSELERELLGSLRNVGPKGDEKEHVWRGVAARIAAVTVVGASAATASSAAAASSSAGSTGLGSAGALGWALKLGLVAAITGGVAGGGYFAVRAFSKDATPVPSALVRAVPSTPMPAKQTAPAPASGPAAEAVETRVPSERPSGKRRAGTPSEMLAAESALLAEARAKLRGGDPSGAEATLDRLRVEFPAGVLSQEREVLAIEVLASRGDRASARQRAARFVQAHPNSPHSETLRRFVEKP